MPKMGDTEELTLENVAKLVQSIQTSLEVSNQNMTQMNQNMAEMNLNMVQMKSDIINTVSDTTANMVKQEISNLKESFGNTIVKVNKNVKENTVKTQHNSNTIHELVKKDKRNNLILYNFPCTGNWRERETAVLSLFQDTMQTSCTSKDIDFIKNLRKTPNPPVLVGLTTWRMKMEILNKRKNLKDSKISLDEDYTPEVVKKRKQLRATMKSLKEGGLKNVQLRHAMLYVDGKPWNEDSKDDISNVPGSSNLNNMQKLQPRSSKKHLSLLSQNKVSSPRQKSNKRNREGDLTLSLQKNKSTKLTQPLMVDFLSDARASVSSDHSLSQTDSDSEDLVSLGAAQCDKNLMDKTLVPDDSADVTSPNDSFNSVMEKSAVDMEE
ncbi:uncharacterized protein LOC103521025 [Diaphorina citri]|uniref:Uncharacterized protein LOC103521025 n=1 Tax=Diaphorina citri TaxID=121845 RepID=A0A1S3DM35_DIACI|nr:uncharacterized protein LOC103521025 [Diaphorina citri]KAI5694772.1 hypothetical protein M8J75_005095 [Diaphorina citri]KAI5702415.1 hypothetical protein M8J76_010791 [Diaphorina citri]